MGAAGPGSQSAQLAQACIADYELGLGPKVTSSTTWNRISPTEITYVGMCGIVNSLVWPVLNSAMPKHKLILHISVALCFRPSGTGCWVRLKCSQFKTCVFEGNLEFTFFLLWQISLSVLPQYDRLSALLWWYKEIWGKSNSFFNAESSQGSLQTPQELCHRKTILSIDVGSLHRSCSRLNDYNCEMHLVKLGTLY